jgi:uncharacterized repeat protein (TIGR03803 family)
VYTFTPSINLSNIDGIGPHCVLVVSGDTMYGTTFSGGSCGRGTVFKVNTDGTGFMTLHNFSSCPSWVSSCTNDDGISPLAGLFLSGSTLYGTTSGGGRSSGGTVYKVNTDGTGFTTVHNFDYCDSFPAVYAGVVLSGSTLYGATYYGTNLFSVNTDGTGFTTTPQTLGDPVATFVLSGKTLYGADESTVFAMNTDLTGFRAWTYTSGIRGLVLSGNTLYGTDWGGGSWGSGSIFSISFSPQLTIVPSGSNIILTWPTNYAGFDYTGFTLQSTTNLHSPVWTTNLPAPIVVNGQYAVTNPIWGTQQFFRLSQ